MPTVSSAFLAAVSADPARPLLTWYDDATGERTELSGATLANWVAKTANLLVDGCGLGPGSIAAIDLPPHWQTASLYLSAWTAGLSVATAAEAVDVAFIGPTSSSADAADVFAVGLHPFALPVRDLAPGVQDWVSSARVHGDHYRGPLPTGTDLALGAFTHDSLVSFASDRAAAMGLTPGTRVLLTVDDHSDVVDWLVAPLVAGCTLVLSAHTPPSTLDARAAVERAVLPPR
ncbi:MAG: TIGR03089 family protein [Hamadaea sp.]|uniref:TIGR03089 family protein n=1 Tax=Hamadaea sp. TaxID=2024425 RepID=UPI0018103559|nr:TIGR03089 family protein [Hamadaea sp.]NUR72951.1 TIGR03089 family protein [Hamadaea sp.]NUT23306.1 TIGR03089 family protein [Hamadaea sp.]